MSDTTDLEPGVIDPIVRESSAEDVRGGGWGGLAEAERLVSTAVRELCEHVDFDDPGDRAGETGAAIVHELATGIVSAETGIDIAEALRLGLGVKTTETQRVESRPIIPEKPGEAMSSFADFSTTRNAGPRYGQLRADRRAPVYRGPIWDDVKRTISDAGFHLDCSDSFIGLAPCPYSHPEETVYYLAMAWESPDDDGSLFYVECGCGGKGPLADDPVEAIRAYEGRS